MPAASYDYDVLVIGSGFGGSVAAVMKQVAGEMGTGHTFALAPVGVFFGRDGRMEPGVAAGDPFFGGAGPRRRGCLEAGTCMTGSRHNAKNRKKHDFTRGVAITSAIHPDDRTQIEPVRYGPGSNAMGLLSTLMTDGGGRLPRGVKRLGRAARHPGQLASLYGGFPLSSVGEMADIPMTAHFIGGCVIGDSADSGVVDAYHRLYGHPGLHVVDGSAISANLGVNPALTITAQAERAMALWPNQGQADPRPALGAAYQRLAPIKPRNPAVAPRPRLRRCGCRSPRTVRGPGDLLFTRAVRKEC